MKKQKSITSRVFTILAVLPFVSLGGSFVIPIVIIALATYIFPSWQKSLPDPMALFLGWLFFVGFFGTIVLWLFARLCYNIYIAIKEVPLTDLDQDTQNFLD
ncbi:hypothetical protein KKG15_03330 [Patescibacteria group bacterium]|nr:hypothetical protein [Patescibacteria group bacterium]